MDIVLSNNLRALHIYQVHKTLIFTDLFNSCKQKYIIILFINNI